MVARSKTTLFLVLAALLLAVAAWSLARLQVSWAQAPWPQIGVDTDVQAVEALAPVIPNNASSGSTPQQDSVDAASTTVTAVSPAANSHGAALDATLVITLSGAIQESSVTTDTVVVHGGMHGRMAGAIGFGSILYDPADSFFPGELVQTSVTGGVLDGAGDPIQPYVWQFRSAPRPGSGDFAVTHTVTTTVDGVRSVGAADVDGDGDLDLFSASSLDDTIAWYENDGSGTFAIAHTITTAIDGWSVKAADVDGDGDMDLLTASFNDNTVAWYENDGGGNFTFHAVSTTASGAASVAAADVDGDGDLDLLAACSDSDTIAWYENDGSGSFAPHTVTTTALWARSVEAADVDGDGDLDLLAASAFDDTIAWHENDGSGTFAVAHTVTTTADYAVSVAAADMDGDGDVDLLAASFYDDTVAWYENDGTGDYGSHTVSTTADGAYSVGAADVDGDGDMDLITASSNDDTVAWYENDGSGHFGFHPLTTSADGAWSVEAADVDGDGDLDLIAASRNSDTVAWYENASVYIVTPSAGEGGRVDPDTPQVVDDGDTASFTVTADEGYTTDSAVGGTCPAGGWSGDLYTTGAITADCTVSFGFTLNSYTVTPSAGTGGSVDPDTAQTVNHGYTASFTVTADEGYTTDSAVGGTCPAGGWSGDLYTTGAITADCTVSFSFTLIPVTDLAVEQTVRSTAWGFELTLVARNLGPNAADGAVISDTFPIGLGEDITWACASAGGAVCPTATGSGDIEEILATFPAGSVVTYTVSAQSVFRGGDYNTVTITPPEGVQDLDPSNNSNTCRTPYRLMLPLINRNWRQ